MPSVPEIGVVALAELTGEPLGAVPRGVGVVPLTTEGPAYVGKEGVEVVEYWPLLFPSVPEIGVVAFAELIGEPLGAVPYAGREAVGVVENWPLRFPSVPEIGVVAFAEFTGEPLGAVPRGVGVVPLTTEGPA